MQQGILFGPRALLIIASQVGRAVRHVAAQRVPQQVGRFPIADAAQGQSHLADQTLVLRVVQPGSQVRVRQLHPASNRRRARRRAMARGRLAGGVSLREAQIRTAEEPVPLTPRTRSAVPAPAPVPSRLAASHHRSKFSSSSALERWQGRRSRSDRGFQAGGAAQLSQNRSVEIRSGIQRACGRRTSGERFQSGCRVEANLPVVVAEPLDQVGGLTCRSESSQGTRRRSAHLGRLITEQRGDRCSLLATSVLDRHQYLATATSQIRVRMGEPRNIPYGLPESCRAAILVGFIPAIDQIGRVTVYLDRIPRQSQGVARVAARLVLGSMAPVTDSQLAGPALT